MIEADKHFRNVSECLKFLISCPARVTYRPSRADAVYLTSVT
ncbi:hypothetical protein E2C01_083184 [Portunus trituberculatus]|uniref:Uncharacterized protein n=1 Tax=Portunus trituberculatus TaxID=210409 RepID=A0A5B7J743_PORTR|nr:hypothetical protein [Portunus trituberculatus]